MSKHGQWLWPRRAPCKRHESTFFVQCSECVGGAGDSSATGSASGHRAVAPISTGQFRSTGATACTPGGRAGGSACLFGHRVLATRRPIKGGGDDRSGFVEGSNATFLLPAAGRERGPTRTPFLPAGRTAPTPRPSDRRGARD